MSMKLKVTTSGTQNVQTAIRKLVSDMVKGTQSFVTIGIHEDAGQHPDADMNNATLGAILHFGSSDGRIPPRPWLDVGVAQGNKTYLAMIQKGIEDGEDLATVLDRVGVVAAAMAQEYMTDLDTPPNAPGTVDKKGSSNPLIDTGNLRQSVTHKVQRGGGMKEGIG